MVRKALFCPVLTPPPALFSHLHYILMELLKNSMRATADFHGLDEMDMHPIRVVIADGEGVSRRGLLLRRSRPLTPPTLSLL
jgi:hypothetical protein